MARNIGLDLGSSRTAIVLRGRGTVLCEPTVVLLNEEEEEMVAVGEKAAQMIGKTPEELSICYPVRYGSVVHCDEACAMLYEYLNRAAGTLPGKKSVLCGVAGRTTEIERLALEEIICDAGAKDVLFVEQALLAAAGAGMKVTQARGNMIIDIGAGTTEIAVISMGCVVASESLRTAGDAFDAELEGYLRRTYGMVVDAGMARQLKEKIGAVDMAAEDIQTELYGRNAVSGLPMMQLLRTAELVTPLQEVASTIAEGACRVLEDTPPEMVADILQDGICLSGGGALLRGIDSYLATRCHTPVQIASAAADCTAAGLAKMLSYKGDFQRLFHLQAK